MRLVEVCRSRWPVRSSSTLGCSCCSWRSGSGADGLTRGKSRRPPKGRPPPDRLPPLGAAGAPVLLSAANPKNLLPGFAGAAVIARAGISGGQRTIAFALFALIASLGVGAPVALYFALGERSRRMLDALKGWMARNSAVIMADVL